MKQIDERTEISKDHDILATFFYMYAVIIKQIMTETTVGRKKNYGEAGLRDYLDSLPSSLGTDKLLLMTYLISTMTGNKKPLVMRFLGYDMIPEESGFIPERLSVLLRNHESPLAKELATVNLYYTEGLSDIFLLPLVEIRNFLKNHFYACTKDCFDEVCSGIDSAYADIEQYKLARFCFLSGDTLKYWAQAKLLYAMFRKAYSKIESKIEQTSDGGRLAVYAEEKKIFIYFMNMSIESADSPLGSC